MHGGPGLTALNLKDQIGHLLAFQIIEQGGSEGIAGECDHGLSVAARTIHRNGKQQHEQQRRYADLMRRRLEPLASSGLVAEPAWKAYARRAS